MKKMRVHIVNKYFFPVTAGIETNLMEVYRRFVEKEHLVTVHASTDTLSKKDVLKKGETVCGMKVLRYPYKWFGFIPQIPLDKVDVISLHNFTVSPNIWLMIWVSILKIIGRKKFVLILSPQSGFNPDWDSFPKLKAQIKLFLHQTIGKLLINFAADGIRAISEWERNELIKAGIRKDLIELIGNGTNEEVFKITEGKVDPLFVKQIKELVPYLIQIGRIHPIKNYETSIKAFSKTPDKYKLLIVGSVENQKYFHKLKTLIQNLKLEQRIIFLNNLTEAEKFYALKNAELMVHMSRHEGYCIAVHEGMSSGLVCVVSNTTALPGLIKEGVNGYLVNPDDVNGVYEKLEFILKNKTSKAIKKMQKNNLTFAKKNTWSNTADKIEKFYLEKFNQKYSFSQY